MSILGGRNFEDVGSSQKPLLLKSNGVVRVQWGLKFIDLIKNGKINVDTERLLYKTDDKDSIYKNGIYIVDDLVYIYFDGELKALIPDSTFVSYELEQKLTTELIIQALKNLGIYCSSKDLVTLTEGFVYIANENRLYTVHNGELTASLTQVVEEKAKDSETQGQLVNEVSTDASYLKSTDNIILYTEVDDDNNTTYYLKYAPTYKRDDVITLNIPQTISLEVNDAGWKLVGDSSNRHFDLHLTGDIVIPPGKSSGSESNVTLLENNITIIDTISALISEVGYNYIKLKNYSEILSDIFINL